MVWQYVGQCAGHHDADHLHRRLELEVTKVEAAGQRCVRQLLVLDHVLEEGME